MRDELYGIHGVLNEAVSGPHLDLRPGEAVEGYRAASPAVALWRGVVVRTHPKSGKVRVEYERSGGRGRAQIDFSARGWHIPAAGGACGLRIRRTAP